MPFSKRIIAKCRRYIHPLSAAFFLSALLALVCHVCALLSLPFADFFNRRVASVVRGALAYITGWIPFSFAEFLIVLIPVWIGLLIFLIVRVSRRHVASLRLLTVLLSVLCLFYSLFVFTLGTGYATSTLHQKLDISGEPADAQGLYQTALWLSAETAVLADQVNAAEGKNSDMPFSHAEMNRHLIQAYDTLCDQYVGIQRLHVGVKPVLLSYPMSYTHLTGVYTFFTGEANLNTAFPDYATVFTAAHEMAHQRGIARENEANFVAFLACIASENDYVRYAGYLNMLEYVMNALYQADRTLFMEVWDTYPDQAIHETLAYNDFCEQFEDSTVGEIAGTVNNGYLQAVGGGGTVSYGLVVDLAVAYHASRDAS